MNANQYRYSGTVLSKDYLRAGVGLVATAGPVIWLDPLPTVAMVLTGLAVLFGVFAARTGLRQFTAIEITSDGIAARGPLSCHMQWHDVRRVRLDYFSIGREGRRGWMQLKVSSRFRHIRVDSTIDDFNQLAAKIAEMAQQYGIPLPETAVANFHALGIAVAGGDREVAA